MNRCLMVTIDKIILITISVFIVTVTTFIGCVIMGVLYALGF